MPDGSITTADVLFLFAVIAAVAGAWWRVEAAVSKAKAEAVEKAREAALTAAASQALAQLTQAQLAEHKLHVAETYITKAGLKETTEQIMGAISDTKASVDRLAGRLDNLVDRTDQTAARQR